MNLDVAMIKSRAVTRYSASKYDVTNIKIAIIHFEIKFLRNFCTFSNKVNAFLIYNYVELFWQ